MKGIEKDKSFLAKEEILKVLQQSKDGTPAHPMNGKKFDTFPVTSVKPYYVPETPAPAWHETDVGIAVLLSIFLSLILLAIILGLYFYCTRHGPDRYVKSVGWQMIKQEFNFYYICNFVTDTEML